MSHAANTLYDQLESTLRKLSVCTRDNLYLRRRNILDKLRFWYGRFYISANRDFGRTTVDASTATAARRPAGWTTTSSRCNRRRRVSRRNRRGRRRGGTSGEPYQCRETRSNDSAKRVSVDSKERVSSRSRERVSSNSRERVSSRSPVGRGVSIVTPREEPSTIGRRRDHHQPDYRQPDHRQLEHRHQPDRHQTDSHQRYHRSTDGSRYSFDARDHGAPRARGTTRSQDRSTGEYRREYHRSDSGQSDRFAAVHDNGGMRDSRASSIDQFDERCVEIRAREHRDDDSRRCDRTDRDRRYGVDDRRYGVDYRHRDDVSERHRDDRIGRRR